MVNPRAERKRKCLMFDVWQLKINASQIIFTFTFGVCIPLLMQLDSPEEWSASQRRQCQDKLATGSPPGPGWPSGRGRPSRLSWRRWSLWSWRRRGWCWASCGNLRWVSKLFPLVFFDVLMWVFFLAQLTWVEGVNSDNCQMEWHRFIGTNPDKTDNCKQSCRRNQRKNANMGQNSQEYL